MSNHHHSNNAVRLRASDGEIFEVPAWCFVVGSKATSALHTVCAKAAVHSTAPLVQLSQPLPQLNIVVRFMVEGKLPVADELSVAEWLELHRTSALLHYPTLRDAVEGILLSLSSRGRPRVDLAASFFPVSASVPPSTGLTASEYMSRTWQGLYSPSAPVDALGATVGAFSLTATSVGTHKKSGGVAAAARDTMLPDPFGFTRRHEE